MKNLTLLTLVLSSLAIAQQPPPKNPAVETIVKDISAQHIKATVEKLASFGTRHTLSDTVSPTRGIGAARRWIKSEFDRSAQQSGGRMEVQFHETVVPPSPRVPYPTNVVNVVALLYPDPTHHRMPDRVLVIGGHYDSRASNPLDSLSDAPGANDDASGTALVMELARVFSRHRFDATIAFIAYAGEEQGLLGATAWAEMAKQRGWNVEAVFNNDIVGNSKAGDGSVERGYVRLFSMALSPVDTGIVLRMRNAWGLENDGPSRSLARYIKEMGERYNPGFGVKMVYRLDRFSRGGDHRPFHERGYAAVRFSEVKENYDHQHQDVRKEGEKQFGDMPQFMDFEYCANIARINAAALAMLALAPAPPKGVGLVDELSYVSTLRWNKNMEPDVAGYYVRYRETNSPVWQQGMFTTDTTVTLKVSKDEYLFGVQVVDREGNVGLVTPPRAVRR